ncbi:MAG: hypothetical protein NTZ48_00445, partial [Candidatus Omnitrophica bacterium]|nr:hypothetical protein [Candidatus Omnitrophota bacterium]
SEEASSPLPISTVSKGTPATLLRYMHDNRIFSDNPKKSSEMAFQRGGNDSLRTIQRELQVLRAVGLVGGNAQDGYYLPEWMRTQDLEAIIKQNQELNFPSPTNEQIESIKIRISERTGVSYKELFQDQLSVEYGGKAARL